MKNSETEWQKFLCLCTKIKTPQQFANLFAVLLTHAEKEDITARYTILTKLLAGEKKQREIAKELKLSIAKITRGSNALKIADKKMLKLLSSNSKTTNTPKKKSIF